MQRDPKETPVFVSRLIVCEKSGRWAAAVKAALPEVRPCEVRSLTQCQRELDASPHSIAAVETTAENLEFIVGWLGQSSSRHPDVRFVALLSPGLAAAEALLREAGAVEVLASVSEAPILARMAARQSRLVPSQAGSFRELVAERLPFAAHA
jgi:hypothetical protein